MKQDKAKKQELWSKLQADIDQILNDVGHIFDGMAEYTQESDPINIIDIDKVLEMEIPKKYIRRPESGEISAPRRKSLQTWQAEQRKFAAMQPKKIVRAMPRELQQEVRIYEKKIGTQNPRRIKSAANIFFKKLEY